MIYLDTSCLLKLLWEEPESADVREAVRIEERVVISSLVELEAETQLKAAFASGGIRLTQLRKYQAQLAAMRNFDPFEFRPLPGSVFTAALKQHRDRRARYCRPLDRLHLAAMEELRIKRIMTLDEVQAEAAEALGFIIVRPGLKAP